MRKPGPPDLPDPKADLQRYLQQAREVLVWKIEGLSEYDMRRPLVPTGTNLLGIVKHLASVELGYFGETFGRPWPEPHAWTEGVAGEGVASAGAAIGVAAEGAAETNADMWVTADESSDEIVDLYRRAWAHSDETISALDLDARGAVPWWPADRREVTLQRILVHVIAETNRHAGHADIVRELIDGAAGYGKSNDNMAPGDSTWWESYRGRLEAEARRAGEGRRGDGRAAGAGRAATAGRGAGSRSCRG